MLHASLFRLSAETPHISECPPSVSYTGSLAYSLSSMSETASNCSHCDVLLNGKSNRSSPEVWVVPRDALVTRPIRHGASGVAEPHLLLAVACCMVNPREQAKLHRNHRFEVHWLLMDPANG